MCDTEIRACLASGQIVIDPPPLPEHLSTSALDLTLGRGFRHWKKPPNTPGVAMIIGPSAPQFYPPSAEQYQEPVPVDDEGAAIIRPGELMLVLTEQRVELPHQSRIAARVEGRSNLTRLGLIVHLTAPAIHAGFKGHVTLEVANLGPHNIRLAPGLPACQLIFEMVFGTPSRAMRGMLMDQDSVTGALPQTSPPD